MGAGRRTPCSASRSSASPRRSGRYRAEQPGRDPGVLQQPHRVTHDHQVVMAPHLSGPRRAPGRPPSFPWPSLTGSRASSNRGPAPELERWNRDARASACGPRHRADADQPHGNGPAVSGDPQRAHWHPVRQPRDRPTGYSAQRMVKMLRERCQYVIRRGATLNNPHIPKNYFDGWERITEDHAARLRELVRDYLSASA